jgi:O-succinylbenzoate synthase
VKADFAGAVPYAIPLRTRFRGITVREGMLLRGDGGWGEFCPFPEYGDAVAASWLATAVEQCTVGWPAPVRTSVPVNCTVPVVSPAAAAELVRASGCATAKVKVAEGPLADDVARVAAVRAALGPSGAVRVDANAAWSVSVAVSAIRELDAAAGGLQYVEQPCRSLDELAAVRSRVDVPIAADESIRTASDPMRVAVAGAADIAVIKCTPLGGVRRALRVAEAAGLPCVVSSALETSVGMGAELALAGALPSLDFACGLGTVRLFTGDVVGASAIPVDGMLEVPAVPVDPLPELLEEFRMRDAERAAWWAARLERARQLLP